jgi:hypothetical protein
MISQNACRSKLAIIVFLAALAGTTGTGWTNHGKLRDEVRQFHRFLQDHPKVSSELRKNPNLINSKRYLNQHDDLQAFLKRHPAVKREIVTHPSRVFGRYYRDNHPRWNHR